MNLISNLGRERCGAQQKKYAKGWLVFLFALTLLSACSSHNGDELAVAKMPKSQMQATEFLRLNEDKPGTPVDVQHYLVPGKYTIVEYLSPYDGLSVNIEQRLAQLCQVRRDIAVRIVNINRPEVQQVDWESPVIQYARIQKLPFIQIYDPNQSLRAQGRPAYQQVIEWVRALPN
jgi:hypothetical protein